MKLAAVLACRNQSSRLYAKPLQNLDVKNSVTILDYMISQIKFHPDIEAVALAISEQEENKIYERIAKEYGIPYVLGDDRDVLDRLIKGAESLGASNIFRITTESPYTYYGNLKEVYEYHLKNDIECSLLAGLSDGAGYEIIKLSALKKSWDLGLEKHRSELCSLYIYENQDKFRVAKHDVEPELRRLDMRLTVDWPEDLIVMREIYQKLNLNPKELLDFKKVIDFLDKNPKINAINNWISSKVGRAWY